jgi:hypothetical protein
MAKIFITDGHISSSGSISINTGVSLAGQFTSTVAQGTAPLIITSNTLVTNLNSDLWDGYQFSDYLNQAVKTTSSPTLAGLNLYGNIVFTNTDKQISKGGAGFYIGWSGGTENYYDVEGSTGGHIFRDSSGGYSLATIGRTSNFFGNLGIWGRTELRGSIYLINKAQDNWLTFASRNTSGTEAVYDLANVGKIQMNNTLIWAQGASGVYNASYHSTAIYHNMRDSYYTQSDTAYDSFAIILGKNSDYGTNEGVNFLRIPAGTNGASSQSLLRIDNAGSSYFRNSGTFGGNLTVNGTGVNTFSGVITSNVAQGTAPFVVSSTTQVANLNAELWAGNKFADYLNQAVKTTSKPSFSGAIFSSKILVTAADQSTARIQIQNTTTNGHQFDLIAGVHNVTQECFSIYDATAGATRLRIENDGSVTIGGGQKVGANTLYVGNATLSGNLTVNGSGNNYFASYMSIGKTSNGYYKLDVAGSIRADNDWFYTTGNTGWYNSTHGGGWWMDDDTYIKSYGGKTLWIDGMGNNYFAGPIILANDTAINWKDSGGIARRTFLLSTSSYHLGAIDNDIAASLYLYAGGDNTIYFRTNGVSQASVNSTGMTLTQTLIVNGTGNNYFAGTILLETDKELRASNNNGRILLSGNLHIDSFNGNDILLNYYSNRNTYIYSTSGIMTAHFDTQGHTGLGMYATQYEMLSVNGSIRVRNAGGSSDTVGFFLNNAGTGGTDVFSITRQGSPESATVSLSGFGGIGLTGGRTGNNPAQSGYTLYVSSDNKVGIGTTVPKTKLHIYTDTYGITEALRLQGKYNGTGHGPFLRFTNYHGSATNPNTGEYNLAAIYAYDYDSAWGGAIAFQTAGSGGTGTGFDLTTKMVITPNGNVGIGTTSPSGTLHVSGTTILADAYRFYTGASDGSTSYTDFRTNPATGNGIISAKVASLFFNYDHGNAGTFWANGSGASYAYMSSTGQLTLNNNAILGGTNIPSVRNTLDANGGVAIGTYANVNTAPTNGMIISGYVGIGTTTPKTALQIGDPYSGVYSGWSSSATQGILIGNDTDNVYFGLVDEGSNADRPAIIFGDDSDDYLRIMRNDSSGNFAELMRINYDGKVGILGVASNYALEVNGDIFSANGWLRTSGNAGWYSQTYGGGWYMTDTTWIRTYNDKQLWAGSTGSNYFAGKIGVATSSPAEAIDVKGNIAVRSTSSTKRITMIFNEAEESLDFVYSAT